MSATWRLVAAPALLVCALLAACQKKEAPPPEPSPAPAPAASATAAQDDPAARERQAQQAKLDYAQMEDGYINDPKGQWATSASASSSYGEKPGEERDPNGKLPRALGAPDGNAWSNNQQDVGFDWLQAEFAKPVHATAVRVVTTGGEAVQALTKIELIDEAGQSQTAWSGLSEQKPDERGSRSWFVREFAKTATPIKAVKLTFANNVAMGYKEVDAVQLVGE